MEIQWNVQKIPFHGIWFHSVFQRWPMNSWRNCLTIHRLTYPKCVHSFDMHHEKTDRKVFVVVIPIEGLVGWGPANPSFGMAPTIKYYSNAFIDYSVFVVIPKEGLVGPLTVTKTLRSVFSWCAPFGHFLSMCVHQTTIGIHTCVFHPGLYLRLINGFLVRHGVHNWREVVIF